MRRLALAFVAAILTCAAAIPVRATDQTPSNDAPVATGSGQGTAIDILAEPSLRFTDVSGEPITGIRVVPGETVEFRVTNTSGFDQNFYIGADEQLREFDAATDTGIATWQSGTQELVWLVPDDVSGLRFGSTVPGHYVAGMQGDFSAVAAVPDGPDGRFEYGDPLHEPRPEPEPTRYEMPEQGFALDLPWDWPPVEPGSVGFTLAPLELLDVPAGVADGLLDDISRRNSVDRARLGALVEAGQEAGAALMGFWWSRPPTDPTTLPDEFWSVIVVPWEGATIEQIRSFWVEDDDASTTGREVAPITLPSGEALLVREDGPGAYQTYNYYLTDGRSVIAFLASSLDPPDDRWLSIVETIEFLPVALTAGLPTLSVAGGNRVERPDEGFALTVPADWDVEDAEPETDPLLFPADTDDEPRWAGVIWAGDDEFSCAVIDTTRYATQLGFQTVEDAVAWEMEVFDEELDGPETLQVMYWLASDADEATSTTLELPAGRAGVIDTSDPEWPNTRTYVLTDGDRWLYLHCDDTFEPPADRWLSIAETFEWLPAE